jgi:mannose/fructose/N-acetylgalactosamine-specific phosphotransferase system component IIC
MDKAIHNPMFITGGLLAIFGLGVCLNRLLRGESAGYLAFGLFVSGCTLLLVGWMQRNK